MNITKYPLWNRNHGKQFNFVPSLFSRWIVPDQWHIQTSQCKSLKSLGKNVKDIEIWFEPTVTNPFWFIHRILINSIHLWRSQVKSQKFNQIKNKNKFTFSQPYIKFSSRIKIWNIITTKLMSFALTTGAVEVSTINFDFFLSWIGN